MRGHARSFPLMLAQTRHRLLVLSTALVLGIPAVGLGQVSQCAEPAPDVARARALLRVHQALEPGWEDLLAKALGLNERPRSLATLDRDLLDTLRRRDSVQVARHLAYFTVSSSTADDYGGVQAGLAYRRLSGRAGPMLAAILDASSPHRRGLGLSSIDTLLDDVERDVVLSLACDALVLLNAVALGGRATMFPRAWLDGNAQTISEARRLLGERRPRWLDRAFAATDSALHSSWRPIQ